MIMELVSNAIGAVKGWFDWKSSGVGQRKAAEAMVDKAETAAKKRKAEINRAVFEGDAAKVNAIVAGCAAASLAVFAGCFSAPPAPVYVAADREVSCVTNAAGAVEYWKVPPLVMEDLLDAKVELGELKKELKIKEIVK